MKTPDALAALSALAQETRLDVFRLLVQAGPPGMPAGGIAEALGVPSATLSFHLKELRHAGVVTCRRAGRSLLYGADFAVMDALLRFLTEHCCRGAARASQAAAPIDPSRPQGESRCDSSSP